MKYFCLEYLEPAAWDALSPAERENHAAQCAEFERALRQRGQHGGGGRFGEEGLLPTTVRRQAGELHVGGGAAEGGAQLRGILVVEAEDLNHAIQVASRHPDMRIGGHLEIWPAEPQ